MRLSLFILLTLLAGACSDGNLPQSYIYIDLNSTSTEPIVAQSLTGSSQLTDTATAGADGVYIFDTKDWDADIYRLRISQDEAIDVVVNKRDNVSIVARKNYCREATTNSRETQILWQVDSLQKQFLVAIDTIGNRNQPLTLPENRKRAAAAINRCRTDIRAVLDTLLAAADSSIVSLAILKVGNGTANAYDIIDDHGEMTGRVLNIETQYKSNALAKSLLQQLEAVNGIRNAVNRFAVGKAAPKIDFVDKYDNERSTGEFAGVPHVIVYGTEANDELLYIWQSIIPQRFNNVNIIGLIPPETDRAGKVNTTFGEPKRSADVEILRQFQPVVISVGSDGQIQDITLRATAADFASK